eukprot:TRINITY_DN6907_c0_g1_i1.p1 TRINITY_DN6907_c0_g1~~TRINITY_DN6907_c0_g1_i1.p1  ORF type:complete len:852 (+),score=329.49 TRINITY_DN6907_c0_g1_i1:52-2607(+)
MIRRPPRSTQSRSSAASDVYKRQVSTQSTWGINEKKNICLRMLYTQGTHVNNNYRIIIISKEMSGDRAALRDAVCTVKLGSLTQSARLPFKEALVFDLEALDPFRTIHLTLELGGRAAATGRISIPTILETSAEVEREEQVLFEPLDASVGQVRATFFLLYLNRTVYAMRKSADRVAETTARSRSPLKPTRPAESKTGERSASNKKPKLSHEELAGYLDRVIDGYIGDARTLLENKGIEDSMYLNRFNRLIAGEEFFGDQQPDTRSVEQIRQEAEQEYMSPDRLRERFQDSPQRGSRRASPGKTKVSGGPGDLTTMMLNAEVRRHVNEYRNQIEYLKLVVLALDLKLKDHDLLKQEVVRLTGELSALEESRRLLQATSQETTNELTQEIANVSRLNEDLRAEKNERAAFAQEARTRLEETQAKLDRSEQLRAKAETEMADLRTRVRMTNELKAAAEAANEEVKRVEARRLAQQEEFFQRIHALNGQMEALREENFRLEQEHASIANELNDANHRNTQLKISLAQSNSEVESLKKRIEVEEAKASVHRDVQAQRDALLGDLARIKLLNANYERILDEFKEETANRIREQDNMNQQHLETIAGLQRRLAGADERISQLTDELNVSKLSAVDLRKNISTLEQMLVIKEDAGNQLEALKQSLVSVIKEKEELRQHLEANSEFIIGQDDKTYDLQKIVVYLKGVITQKDEYILNLKKLIVDMKEKAAIYVPVANDPVDRRLADYLNNVTDQNKLRVLFIRESEGVYLFGTKRIYVKVDLDKVMIRVGGGFLSIDEFLDQYVPVELERLARNDPVRMLTNNLAVHKTVAGRGVNQIEPARTTPVQYRNQSPLVSRLK